MSEYKKASESQKQDRYLNSKQSSRMSLLRGRQCTEIIQRVRMCPKSLTTADVMQLQKTIGNRAVCQLMEEIKGINLNPIQRKEAGDDNISRLFCLDVPVKKVEITEKEMPTQGKFQTVRKIDNELEDKDVQMKKENKTGLPDELKTGVENLSGVAMDDVRVHYNSDKPAQMGALAYTQGTDIYVASGQEEHLPHESWHVIQQVQGRVRTNNHVKGVAVNDDTGLEKEADEMGSKAEFLGNSVGNVIQKAARGSGIVQMAKEMIDPKKRRKEALERLKRSYERNKPRKARPKKYRAICKLQRRHNYGFINKSIVSKLDDILDHQEVVPYNPTQNPKINPRYEQFRIGGAGCYYRKGFGGQPFLYLQSELYDDNMIKSNYDAIIAEFRGKDSEIALELLNIIESGADAGTTRLGQSKSLMVFLTQIIEAHDSRIPGADKLARALFRRIAMGQLTFQQAFNRKDGLFVSAWNKSEAKAPEGGQVAARALFGVAPKKNDHFSMDKMKTVVDDSWFDELATTVDDYYSDDSDEEYEDDPMEEDKRWDEEAYYQQASSSVISQQLVNINKNLGILGLKPIGEIRNLISLVKRKEEIKSGFIQLSLICHPDKVVDPTKREECNSRYCQILEARRFLLDTISELKVKGGLGNDNALEQQMASEGFTLYGIDGDGNCFYTAVLDQLGYLNGVVADPVTIRGCIAQLIIDNANYFRIFVVGGDLDNVVNQILTNQNWNNQGGDLAPQLIATVLSRVVRIITPGGIRVIQPIPGLNRNPNNTFNVPPGGPLVIVYNGFNHYDSTRRNMMQWNI